MAVTEPDGELDERAGLYMRRAGVDVDSKLGQVFARSYNGESLEPDEIRAAYDDLASEAGGPTLEDRQMGAEREALRDVGLGDTGVMPSVGRRESIIERGRARLQTTGDAREDVLGQTFGEIVANAIEHPEDAVPG